MRRPKTRRVKSRVSVALLFLAAGVAHGARLPKSARSATTRDIAEHAHALSDLSRTPQQAVQAAQAAQRSSDTENSNNDVVENTSRMYTFDMYDYRDVEFRRCMQGTEVVKKASLAAASAFSSSKSSPPPSLLSSPHLKVCSETCSNVTDTSGVTIDFERTTATGRDTLEVVQEALGHAWRSWDKRAKGSVDLFVRTGCRDAGEVRFLFESVELFWPRGIGHVVVVLDEADAAVAAKSILPPQTKHSYRVFFERTPCMPGRVFNQVSYLMADYYSSADTIVTIDSDCVFHSPVTPGLLFDKRGRVLLPWSGTFQSKLWKGPVEFFTGPGTYLGQSMVSQPVTVHRATLSAYRRWYAQQHGGRCLLEGVAAFLDTKTPVVGYCWMCQINSFLQITGETADAYHLIDVEDPTSRPYQRFALHVNYEAIDGVDGDRDLQRFKASVDESTKQGLCRTLGARMLSQCHGADVSHVADRVFSYHQWQFKFDDAAKQLVETRYLQGLRAALLRATSKRVQGAQVGAGMSARGKKRRERGRKERRRVEERGVERR